MNRAPSRTLMVDLDGPRITVERFMQAVNGILAVVSEVDREMSGRPGSSVRFVITDLRKRSAHLAAVAEPASDDVDVALVERILATSRRGLASLARSSARPSHFSDRAIEAASGIAKVIEPGWVSNVGLRLGTERVAVSAEVAANAEQVVGERVRSLGSIEGRLGVISVHGRMRCVIYERLGGRAVRCYFPEQELPFLVSAFGRRVAANGIVWSNAEGEPVSVTLESAGDLAVFPRDQDLPSADQVRGILNA